METNRLLALGALCAPVFIITFFTEGLIRRGYDWRRFPISSLSIGPRGWIQMTNFIVTGLLIILLAVGLRLSFDPHSAGSLWAPIAVAIAGIGLVGAGLFGSDPVFGYPMEQPLALKQFTRRGHLHDFFSMFWFTGLPAACVAFTRRFAALGDTGWAIGSILSGIGMIVFFILAGAGFNQTRGLVSDAGLYQRLSVSTGLLWLMFVAIHQIGGL